MKHSLKKIKLFAIKILCSIDRTYSRLEIWLDRKAKKRFRKDSKLRKISRKSISIDIEKLSILQQHKNALDATALVSETDSSGKIIYANDKFLEISGYNELELLGKDHRIINSSYHSRDFFIDLWKTISKSKIWRGDIRNKKKDGSFYWVDSTIIPMLSLDGKIVKYVSIRFDITQKKVQEQQLKELGEAKSKFLAVMSHEIRTPLGAVIGLSELLASTKLTYEQRDYLNDIGKSADLLMNILNDILDLAKLDSGKLELNIESNPIKDVFDSCVIIFKEKAIEKKIILSLEIEKSCPEHLQIDALRIKQIVMNLLSNSIKFTKNGFINISVEYCYQKNSLLFRVKDSGIGMTEQQLMKAFNEFEQADTSTTKKFGGTGLGLPICEKLVHFMNGSIEANSKKNEGTNITISIPAKISIRKSSQLADQKRLVLDNLDTNTRILLAEDYLLNQKVFSRIISHFGLSTKIVGNGLNAVKEAELSKFDIIFLDIQMPIMDGFDACRKIREIEQQNKKQIWIVAISANAFRDDIEKYKKIGFDDFVPKPFNKKLILNAFSNYLGKASFKFDPAKGQKSTNKTIYHS